MCGIGGALSLSRRPVPALRRSLSVMNALLAHRGPDGEGSWLHGEEQVGFAHRRLKIIDLDTGDQPMSDQQGSWITYNGEIYNYRELRRELGEGEFLTRSDTEVVLRAFRRWGEGALERLRGMFAFALWEESTQTLFCARDRFGVKPFYWTRVGDVLYFASEIKALLPFVRSVETDVEGLKDYLSFQACLDGKTLFRDVHELLPGHMLRVRNGIIDTRRYWEVYFDPDFTHDEQYFRGRVRELIEDSIGVHLHADVPIGAFVSGGVDSSAVASLASRRFPQELIGFTGRFTSHPGYDESSYATEVASHAGMRLVTTDIGPSAFVENIERVIYHLDFPVAGPGSFAQYIVSELAAHHCKVVLSGQGGDEIFGGYTRYLIAYFEQCIKGAIEGTMHSGNFVVTYESIIPRLETLRSYKPLLQEFWREGLFDELDKRYFRLINRAPDLDREVDMSLLGEYSPYETFRDIFNGDNVRKESYFDLMTHFDFKTLLPGLLQVEDRVSMAHGLEARVPLLDHQLVELAATMPADIKFKDGDLKHILKQSLQSALPTSILARKDKMGFPVPLREWLGEPGSVRDFVGDVLSSSAARSRAFIDNRKVLETLDDEHLYGRRVWGFLCLELWQRAFHDQAGAFRDLLDESEVAV